MAWQNKLQFLHVALLCFYFLLPTLLCDNLLCYFTTIAQRGESFEFIVTECPPNELCFKGVGHYGDYPVLTFRGCMLEEDCSKLSNISLKGMDYNLSYSCCDWFYCNSFRTAEPLYVTVIFMAVVAMVCTL